MFGSGKTKKVRLCFKKNDLPYLIYLIVFQYFYEICAVLQYFTSRYEMDVGFNQYLIFGLKLGHYLYFNSGHLGNSIYTCKTTLSSVKSTTVFDSF